MTNTKNIALMSDSSCDLTPRLCKFYNIDLVPFYISFDKQNYLKENVDISISEFYQRMRENVIFPKTSLPAINDYYDKFIKHIHNGKDIICVCLSSKFSGSYNAALTAKSIVLDEFPNARIEVIDSQSATGCQGVIVTEIARMINAGLTLKEIIRISELIKTNSRIFFYVDSLDYLEKGGRIGKVAALLGTMLNIKPIIYLADGELFPIGRVRGKRKASERVVELLCEFVAGNEDKYVYAIAHADAIAEVEYLASIIKEQTTIQLLDEYLQIGVTIGSYTGPDTCGVCAVPAFEQFL
ncbi:MAG: EDD domain protein [Epulopiscium sp. Nele67-Bin002]|nr:MAG: EDD domain protein [Epulopiscium sp. Nele67-Bin001]OON91245.1 MAG: EDD domain protein [Epulopiscium sp. Nele67-Bin002]